jgi:hypothetical protein
MSRVIKTFKQFINEDVAKTYYIQIDPFAEEDEIKDSVTEMFAFCLFHTARGSSVLLTARPYVSELSEGVRP